MAPTGVAHFCPMCGHATGMQLHTGRERPVCTACDHVIYFDPKVTAIAFITDGDRVLLAQRAFDPGKDQWALAGGYVEFQEDPKDAARREALEETGLTIQIDGLLDVFFAGPGSPITIAYAASVLSGELQAGDDAKHVEWFTRDQLPDDLVFVSTHALVSRWLKGEI